MVGSPSGFAIGLPGTMEPVRHRRICVGTLRVCGRLEISPACQRLRNFDGQCARLQRRQRQPVGAPGRGLDLDQRPIGGFVGARRYSAKSDGYSGSGAAPSDRATEYRKREYWPHPRPSERAVTASGYAALTWLMKDVPSTYMPLMTVQAGGFLRRLCSPSRRIAALHHAARNLERIPSGLRRNGRRRILFATATNC